MTDQLRYNTGKPEMGYLLVHNHSQIWTLLGIGRDPTVYEQDLLRHMCEVATCPAGYLHTAVLKLLRVVRELVSAEDLCAVYAAGARKYPRGNFLHGASASQYVDSAARHLVAHLRGEAVDTETGCLHLAHMMWNMLQMTRCVTADSRRDDRLYLGAPGLTEPDPDPDPEPEPEPEPEHETKPEPEPKPEPKPASDKRRRSTKGLGGLVPGGA